MPLEVIESTDPISELIRFKTSAIYEMIISLQLLHRPTRRSAWAENARTSLSTEFLRELDAVYKPFADGHIFLEMPVDYDDHDSVDGFFDYVRVMDPVQFVFYLVGRILSPDEIADIGLDVEPLTAALRASPYDNYCKCLNVPFDEILADVPAFQRRLAALWQWYWDEFFHKQIDDLQLRWHQALEDKQNLLARSGGQALYEHVTGKPHLIAPLPPGYPVREVVFVPLYLIPSPVYIFYGYGNITVIFDSERTEARLAEVEQSKESLLAAFKALSDGSRLDILRLITQHEGTMNGKMIAKKLSLSAPTVSRHLGQLKEAGIITEESTDNRTITYKLQREAVQQLPDVLLEYLWH
ncbi:MAG: winged helix-turn-helix transcriptional regulator [Anaerolineae bacterium]|nr:winged helix-turn-helix transcriptional regulator [Anaerolineae bacterium]